MFFTETITEETKKKYNVLHQTHERNIIDIKEKMGEFTTNITNRLTNFINSHKAVKENIIEIRNLKLELEIQKQEIKRVIQDYKSFDKEEKQAIVYKENQQPTDVITTIKQIGRNLEVLALDVEKQKEA